MGGVLLKVKPYLMDLQTTNGTFLNGDKIEDQRYYEVLNIFFPPTQTHKRKRTHARTHPCTQAGMCVCAMCGML